MRFHFTKHAKEKLLKVKKFGFAIDRNKVEQTVIKPVRVEERVDGTYIASSFLDEKHILRVVYRVEGDIIIVITFYPGRRKPYGI